MGALAAAGAGGFAASNPTSQKAAGNMASPITGMFGFGPSHGEYYTPGEMPSLDSLLPYEKADMQGNVDPNQLGSIRDARQRQQESHELGRKMIDYGNGGSLGDLLRSTGGYEHMLGDELATNAFTGSKFATEQVQNNPLLSQAMASMENYNKGLGDQRGRADLEEQDLAKRGFKLQPEDFEAYGQASGDLARLFGTQEQSLAQSLADRGLSSAPNGAAAQSFSGLQGNKFEQLAGLQRQIADQRMKMNQQRLNDTRQYLQGLNQQEGQGIRGLADYKAGAIQDQFGRNLAGVQARNQDRQFGMQADLKANDQLNNDLNAANQNMFDRAGMANNYNRGLFGQRMDMWAQQEGAKRASLEDKRGQKNQNLMDATARGSMKATEAAPGMLMSAGAGMMGGPGAAQGASSAYGATSADYDRRTGGGSSYRS